MTTTASSKSQSKKKLVWKAVNIIIIVLVIFFLYYTGKSVRELTRFGIDRADEQGQKFRMSLALINIDRFDRILREDSGTENIQIQAIDGLLTNFMHINTAQLVMDEQRYQPTLNMILIDSFPEIALRYNFKKLVSVELDHDMVNEIYTHVIRPAHPSLPEKYVAISPNEFKSNLNLTELNTGLTDEFPKRRFGLTNEILIRSLGVNL